MQKNPLATAPELRLVIETKAEKQGICTKTAIVAIVGIVVAGGVASAGLYGYATEDYSILKAFADLAIEGLGKALKAAP